MIIKSKMRLLIRIYYTLDKEKLSLCNHKQLTKAFLDR
jgi:hypothetical protein